MTNNSPAAVCEVCDGMGVVTKNVPIDHPDFGKSFPCPNCSNAILRRRENLRRISNMESYRPKTFESFQVNAKGLSEAERASLEIALSMAQSYADKLEGWLIILGSTGTGKTHLAAAIANEVLARDEGVIFATAPDLLDHLRATFAPDSEATYDQKFDQMKNVRLLVIDDLGAESPSRWAQEKLYQLVNHRYIQRLPTIVVSNLREDQFEARIASRLFDVSITQQMNMELPDFRRGGNQEKQRDRGLVLTDLKRYGRLTFDVLEAGSDRKMVKLAEHLRDYANHPSGWKILMGDTGTGKTHLAAAIANHSQMMQKRGMMVSVPDLIDYLQATLAPGSPTPFINRFEDIRRADLLVLDDFALSERTSEWLAQKIFQLIDHRYLLELPTVITGGLNFMKVLESHHPKIHSRFTDRRLVEVITIAARDYRRSTT